MPSPQRAKRPGISKRLRFEVLKRDQHTCFYCGARAPDVPLEVDHIEPVASGGATEMVNLITACKPCNSGKSDVRLDDATVMEAQRAQLAEVRRKRAEIKATVAKHKKIVNTEALALAKVHEFWKKKFPGHILNEAVGLRDMAARIKRYGLDRLLEAITISAKKCERSQDAAEDTENVGASLDSLDGICKMLRMKGDDPEQARLHYIRAIVRNRLERRDEWSESMGWKAMDWLKAARSWGVTLANLDEAARHVQTWSGWDRAIDELIAEAKGHDDE